MNEDKSEPSTPSADKTAGKTIPVSTPPAGQATPPPSAAAAVKTASSPQATFQGRPAPPPVAGSTESAVAAPKSAGKILLVEDDPPMVKMYSTKLKMEGFEVAVAYDGESGLEKITSWQPDLVVLDLMIPKIGGMEILERLRSDPKTKNLRVVILSNLSQEQDIQKSKQLGVAAYLVKANFTPGQVVKKIKEALGRQ